MTPPPKASSCCAFPPGQDGAEKNIKKISVLFSSDTTTIDVTSNLFNHEPSQVWLGFEGYDGGDFNADDYICTCKNDSTFITYVNKVRLGDPYTEVHDELNAFVHSNIDSLITWYNEESRGGFNYAYFWLPNELLRELNESESITLKCVFEDDSELSFTREIVNEFR